MLHRNITKVGLYLPRLKDYLSILYEIALPFQIVVNVIYWTSLYDYSQPVECSSFWM